MTSWKLSFSFPQLLWKITLTKEDKNTEHISPERKEQQKKKLKKILLLKGLPIPQMKLICLERFSGAGVSSDKMRSRAKYRMDD